ncbi:hypothetical protein DSO57_1035515 [Entomophthora muscae]|uniref:Uncharacterized protein n=1 Tax=Entomophthora muscae TaxID=34485 RepID=A0ACC2SNL6_9FUNG|nr:hypothetical protein DSO57_1035515 [Entomophthora muscae]
MLEKPGVFGALPLSETNASKLASCLNLPSVMVVGIKTNAPAFDPFIQHYIGSAEIKFMSAESKPWPTSIRPVKYLPLETNQVSIPIPLPKSKLPKP